MTRTQSVWHARAPAWPGHAPLQSGQVVEADVVVVGAGVCGAGAVHSLQEAGVRVVWLDAGSVAGEATGRNAGFILQGTAERYDRAVALMGRERARAVHSVSVDNHARMRAVIEALDLVQHCAYARRGSLQLAGGEREEAELRTSAEWLAADGFAAEVLGANELSEVLRAGGYQMAVFLPEDGQLDPVRFVRGVARHAVSKGVRLFEHSRVVALEAPTPGEVRVTVAGGGQVHASLALVCTNASAGGLVPWLADIVDPVRGQMLSTAPAPPDTFRIPIYADHGYDYWRQRDDGRIVLGGWRNLDPSAEVGHQDVLHDDIQGRMTRFLRSFPGLADLQVEHRWSGTMGFSRDGLPVVGPVPGLPGALAAVGFTGHGFGFGWLAGEALAGLVLEGVHPVAELFGSSRLR